MDPSDKRQAPVNRWRLLFSDAESLEAPERSFIGHRDILVQSRARYEFVKSEVRGTVLDVGCGRGYGFEVLGPSSDRQIGIDISARFLKEASQDFPNTFFVRGNGDALPFVAYSFDAVLAFEVIEHAKNGELFLQELRRVARHNAFVAVSTPNKYAASGESQRPLNRFHHREYEPEEFYNLLSRVFPSVHLFGQHERVGTESQRNKLIDRIPVGWKYLVPDRVQTLMSVALRPPLRLDECRFQTTNLEQAQTLLALCRL
jgi:SAM-dependent methyltransferase